MTEKRGMAALVSANYNISRSTLHLVLGKKLILTKNISFVPFTFGEIAVKIFL